MSCQDQAGPSRGSLHRAASLKVEKAHFAASKKGLENRKGEANLPPPRRHPLNAL